MRILLSTDINCEFVCGSNRFVHTLAEALQNKGHEVLIVAPGPGLRSGPYKFNQLSVQGMSSVPSFVQKTLRVAPLSLFYRKPLKQILKEYKPDVIHIQTHVALPFGLLRVAQKEGIPIVGTNHFVPENVLPVLSVPPFIIRRIEGLVWKHLLWVFDQVKAVSTPTHVAKSLLKGGGFKREVEVISNGINLNRFKPKISGFEKGEKILLFVGRLDPEKHLEVVIKALPAALKKVNLRLVIAGRGACLKELEKLVKQLGLKRNVTFKGYVPDEDLPALYRSAYAFVNAGTAELQCIAMMEAMASGLPVLAADAMALPELAHDGENAFLFEPGDSEELAEKIVKLFSNTSLATRMGKKSLELINKHDFDTTVSAFELLYKKAIS